MGLGILGYKTKHSIMQQKYDAFGHTLELVLKKSNDAGTSSLGLQAGSILFVDDPELVFQELGRRELLWGSLACG